jgi:hypothetical protein
MYVDPDLYIESLLLKPQCCKDECLVQVDKDDLKAHCRDAYQATAMMTQKEKKVYIR